MLNKSKQFDNRTICTLSSKDTSPLGTDLDPCNGYNNEWAASKLIDKTNQPVAGSHACGLACDGTDNVGFSYGSEVKKKEKEYDPEGILLGHFRRENIEVVVVNKRPGLRADFEVPMDLPEF